MPVHPAAPADVPGLVEAYRHTAVSFVDLAEGLRAAEWELATSCPGWAARDHLAHVLHAEDVLSGSEHPGADGLPEGTTVEVGSPAHVRNSFGVWMEEGVQARKGRTPRELLDELRGVVEVRSAQMYSPDLELDTPVRAVGGRTRPFGPSLLLRISDLWVHEQDLREAVSRPGSLDTPGASCFVTAIADAFTGIVVDDVAPEPGTVVILECTGPLTARVGVRVAEGEDGGLVGHELFTGQSEDEGEGLHEHPTTSIAMNTEALTRRAAGRRTTEETAYQVVGDEDLARRVVDALAMTP